jgi:two-component sensor histidine kinase
LEHSVNRILAIAAVHELLTERRDEDVELADLLGRLRSMLVQGVGGGKDVTAELEQISMPGARATSLALVFSELLQNALEHGGDRVRVELSRRDGDVLLAISDDGEGIQTEPAHGTGLSIVQALVRDELRGTIDLRSGDGTRVEVAFPVSA